MNAALKFALGRANQIRKYVGLPTFDLSRIRNDLSPKQNLRLLTGRLDLINDVASGTHGSGILTKYTDAAIARYLLVQKGASLATNVAVFTSGTPFGLTCSSTPDNATPVDIRLLGVGTGTAMAKSDGSAAIAIGDAFTAVAGCQKRHDVDCRDKFGNLLNFQGEPHLPGIDALTSPAEADVSGG